MILPRSLYLTVVKGDENTPRDRIFKNKSEAGNENEMSLGTRGGLVSIDASVATRRFSQLILLKVWEFKPGL